jgi:hypothetical protein
VLLDIPSRLAVWVLFKRPSSTRGIKRLNILAVKVRCDMVAYALEGAISSFRNT